MKNEFGRAADSFGDMLLERWAAWYQASCPVQSSISYSRRTIEARLVEFGPIVSIRAGSIVPLRFSGVLEADIHSRLLGMQSADKLAIILRYLWKTQESGCGPVRVTHRMRINVWQDATGKTPRSFSNAIKRARNVARAVVM